MTVNELHELCRSDIKVMSGYNSKVLCYSFNPKKHSDIGKRKVLSIWSDIQVNNGLHNGFHCSANAIICAYVMGDVEYRKDIAKKEELDAIAKEVDGIFA